MWYVLATSKVPIIYYLRFNENTIFLWLFYAHLSYQQYNIIILAANYNIAFIILISRVISQTEINDVELILGTFTYYKLPTKLHHMHSL